MSRILNRTKNTPREGVLADSCKYLGGIDYIITGALIVTTAISGILLSSFKATADNDTIVSTASVTVEVSCSMSATIDTPHNATIPNGIYSGSNNYYPNGIGKTTIATFCNDSNGFAIYAIGFTGDQYSGEDHTKLIGANTNEKIATGTATSGNTSNWAMKLIKETDSTKSFNPANLTITNGYDNYSAVPDTYTKVASYTSITDNTLGSVLSTTYAAYISPTAPADNYTGKVKYTLVHPATEVPAQPQTSAANRICYYANASSAVGTMGCQSITASSTNATLLASNFSRAGYGFAGWSDSFDYATNPNAKFYGPQEYIEFTAGQYSGTNEGLSLYAVWVKSQGSLQDSSKVSSVCSNLTTAPTNGTANLASVSALTDQRDNETYAIAKLADGNCWMIENLRLENTNTDNSTGALAQGYGTSATYGNFSGLASAENANFTSTNGATDTTEPNSLYYAGTQSGTASIDISQTNYAGFRMPRYNNYNHQTTSADRPSNPTTNSATNSSTNAGMYSYGNYYTWAAAMANTGYYNTTTADSDGYTPSEAVKTSLCPKGWKLPYGGNSGKGATIGGFSYLDTQLGGTGVYQSTAEASNRWRNFPNNFLYSGRFYTSSARDRGSYGFYWSSTASSSYYSYLLYLYSSYVYPGTNNSNKYNGNSIRCIAGS